MRLSVLKFKSFLISIQIFFFYIFSNLAFSSENILKFENELNTIESYYWIGLEEKGNYELFLKAFNKIQNLENDIKSQNLPEGIKIKLNGLKEDILQQLDMSSDTLYGVFPLARFFNNNFLTCKCFWNVRTL